MKKYKNHLGHACDLPGDLNLKRYACPVCLARYERNALVHRWFVVFIPDDQAHIKRLSTPMYGAETADWVNRVPMAYQAVSVPYPAVQHRPTVPADVVIGAPKPEGRD